MRVGVLGRGGGGGTKICEGLHGVILLSETVENGGGNENPEDLSN